MKYCVLLCLLFSCVTPKKAEKFLDNNKEFTAKECNERYPIISDTFVNFYYDTVILTNTDTIIHAVNCPSRTIYKVITITKESLAKIELIKIAKSKDSIAYNATYQKLYKDYQITLTELNKSKQKVKARNRIIFWLIPFIILLLLWAFRRIIFNLIV